ncbi:inhibin beta C chain-like [Pyxicephalus adspersus]|uniref:TGF-beta family profile domain-containing protein n=1 Tax=Pyxicephalus adspersus TaxID=30357 RepID=A0AAV3AN44_PYXAD|nr:TPA: hypothetical protein GDO54_000610 [Pyxicephalus adspersus]
MTVGIILLLLLVALQASLVELSCSSCRAFTQSMEAQAEKEMLLEIAKQNILKKLHLHHRPNISHTVSKDNLEQALQRLKINLDKDLSDDLQAENDVDVREADHHQSFEMISFAGIDNFQEVPFILHFRLSADKDKHVEIYQAYLWLHLKATFRQNLTISVSSKHQPGDQSEEGDTINVKVNKGGWFKVYLPMLTGKVVSVGEENIYLELKCRNCQNLLMMDNIVHSRRPFLALKVRNKQEESRTRRHVTECTSDIDICCRRRFYISFKDIGWSDWIISPKGYNMDLCEGKCPIHLARSPGISASSHTAVFSLIKANNIYSNVSLCCVPTKRRSLSILYFDVNNTIVKADVPDMIVENCGCT